MDKPGTQYDDTSFLFEQDRTLNRIYPVHTAHLALNEAIEVDLAALEVMAEEYKTPHFVIKNFTRTDREGEQRSVKDCALHFMQLSNSCLIIAYEKTKENNTENEACEPCAAVLAREKKEAEGTKEDTL